MKIFAHRGDSHRFPENTLIAFAEGLKAGADGFECDLRLTSDGTVVVFHDDDLSRLCGASGTIESSRWNDLKKYKVKGSESIPSLEDILVHFHTSNINLEIKPSARPEVVVEAVLRTLGKIQPAGNLIFSSFDPKIWDCLSQMDRGRKAGKLGLLVETPDLEKLPYTIEKYHPDYWNVPRQILDHPWEKRWTQIKIPPMWVWTLDEPDEWSQVLASSLPFEGIITNKPGPLRQFLTLSASKA